MIRQLMYGRLKFHKTHGGKTKLCQLSHRDETTPPSVQTITCELTLFLVRFLHHSTTFLLVFFEK